mmetsp:Transcript_53210/g.130391  ORF Transcript_53210/g.130391 Transcript_53210/m.130391 type:complete len:308 (-) Transcript_53210:110-1033(-)
MDERCAGTLRRPARPPWSMSRDQRKSAYTGQRSIQSLIEPRFDVLLSGDLPVLPRVSPARGVLRERLQVVWDVKFLLYFLHFGDSLHLGYGLLLEDLLRRLLYLILATKVTIILKRTDAELRHLDALRRLGHVTRLTRLRGIGKGNILPADAHALGGTLEKVLLEQIKAALLRLRALLLRRGPRRRAVGKLEFLLLLGRHVPGLTGLRLHNHFLDGALFGDDFGLGRGGLGRGGGGLRRGLGLRLGLLQPVGGRGGGLLGLVDEAAKGLADVELHGGGRVAAGGGGDGWPAAAEEGRGGGGAGRRRR